MPPPRDLRYYVVPEGGVEPPRAQGSLDFESDIANTQIAHYSNQLNRFDFFSETDKLEQKRTLKKNNAKLREAQS